MKVLSTDKQQMSRIEGNRVKKAQCKTTLDLKKEKALKVGTYLPVPTFYTYAYLLLLCNG